MKDLTPSLDARNLSPQNFRVLREVIWPNAQSDESVLMAFDYCRARRLDPFKRPVHIVPQWDDRQKKMVDSFWPGISEIRTTALRTGVCLGREPVEYGPDKTMDLGSAKGFVFPEWASCVVYRNVGGDKVAFGGDRVYFLETYAPRRGNDPTPNKMWSKRPRGQLAKCAEAAAWRVGFPEELGDAYVSDEISGTTIDAQADPPRAGKNESLAKRLENKGPQADAEPVADDTEEPDAQDAAVEAEYDEWGDIE